MSSELPSDTSSSAEPVSLESSRTGLSGGDICLANLSRILVIGEGESIRVMDSMVSMSTKKTGFKTYLF